MERDVNRGKQQRTAFFAHKTSETIPEHKKKILNASHQPGGRKVNREQKLQKGKTVVALRCTLGLHVANA